MIHPPAVPPATPHLSLEEALRVNKIPVDNHAVIKKLNAAIGIDSYSQTASGRHFKAHRKAGGPDLHTEYGFTNGFVSADEIRAIDPALDHEPSRKRKGLWVVWHPVNNRHDGDGTRASARSAKDYGTCPTCHQGFSATGACWC